MALAFCLLHTWEAHKCVSHKPYFRCPTPAARGAVVLRKASQRAYRWHTWCSMGLSVVSWKASTTSLMLLSRSSHASSCSQGESKWQKDTCDEEIWPLCILHGSSLIQVQIYAIRSSICDPPLRSLVIAHFWLNRVARVSPASQGEAESNSNVVSMVTADVWACMAVVAHVIATSCVLLPECGQACSYEWEEANCCKTETEQRESPENPQI